MKNEGLTKVIAQRFFEDNPSEEDLDLVRNTLGYTAIDEFTPIGASQNEMVEAGYMLATDSRVDPQRCVRLIADTPFFFAHSDVDKAEIRNAIASANTLIGEDHGFFTRLLHSFISRLVPHGLQGLEEIAPLIDSQESLYELWKGLDCLINFRKSAYSFRQQFLQNSGSNSTPQDVTDHVAGLTLSHQGFNLAIKISTERRDLGRDFIQTAQTMALHFATLETLFAGCKTASSMLTQVPDHDGIQDLASAQLLDQKRVTLAVETTQFDQDVAKMVYQGQKVTPLWESQLALVQLSEDSSA